MKLILMLLLVLVIGVGFMVGIIAFALKIGEVMIKNTESKKMKKAYQDKVIYMYNFMGDDKPKKLSDKLRRWFRRKG